MATQSQADVTAADSGSPYEMRLALVLNGGVSLAVWMGGVTAEIDRMRRAAYPALIHRAGSRARSVAAPAGRLGVRLIVDVIAGASAGGLNGAVLAAAIARGQPLPQLRDTWQSVGSIENLASSDGEPSRRRPILDPERQTSSRRAWRTCSGCLENRPEDDSVARDAAGRGCEHEEKAPRGVTLFTTATSMHGRGRGLHRLDEPAVPPGRVPGRVSLPAAARGRGRVQRRHRQPAPDPRGPRVGVVPGGVRARILRGRRDGRPGVLPTPSRCSMRDTAGIQSSRWMVDGGVLDNEPFAPVLDRIARRPITRDVDRIVAYIDPEDATAAAGRRRHRQAARDGRGGLGGAEPAP